MTLTATTSTASAALDHAVFGDVGDTAETVLTTTDHARIGRYQAGLALLMLLEASVLGIVVHGAQGDRAWWSLAGDLVPRWFGAHQNALAVFGVLPLFAGLALVVVPAQIGARSLAFPRLASFALWSYGVAAVTFGVAYLIKEGPPTFNVTDGSLSIAKNRATDLVLASLVLATFAGLCHAVNIVVTVITQRRAGLDADKVRPFTWAAFVASAVTIVSAPVGIAGYLLAYVDQHFGAGLSVAPGYAVAAAHSSYFLGRPEALLPLLLAFGMAADVVVARTGRPLVGGTAVQWLLGLAGGLSLGVWAVGDRIMRSPVAPFGSVAPVFAAVPIALLVLLLAGSIFQAGRFRADPGALLAVVGVLVVAVLGALLGVVAGVRGLDANAVVWFGFGFSAIVVFIGPLLGVVAGIAEHGHLIAGRRVPPGVTALAALALLGGTVLHAALTLPAFGDGGGVTGANQAAVIAKFLVLGGLGLLALGLLAVGTSGALGGRHGDAGEHTGATDEGSHA